ncbi:type II secretion system F family protein [Thauera sp. CAU 1555]|uniref:Type II secretion system F family protein n=1 Tax=Thauera sedimentorum TaxID=2767595 RepID=A0ABR9BE71_9RHOO|nr:type II secretion system F family protein [Thauera sedimentorum]MBC9073706.1 type II secretion system F family protein [Thauera sedimentorum]MBD8504625.1 type II secretion system F family protein [Thauera sedimentorum]
MNTYRYRVRDADGQLREGRLQADSEQAAAAQLLDSGASPLEIAEERSGGGERKSLAALFEPKIRLDDLILFSRQMYSITKAGVPIIQGLARLAESTPNPRFAEVLREISRDLEGGREISAAFARHADIFGTLYVSILRVGEMTGQIETAFHSMYDYLQRDKVVIDRVKAAMRYPMFVIIAIGVAIGVLTVLVIPTFADVFASVNMQLPLATRIILAVSQFARDYWPLVLAAIAAAVVAFRRWTATETGRLTWDRTLLRIPKLGDVLLRATLARFTRAMGVAMTAGVPITQALAGVARASGNMYVAEKILSMRNGVERGDTLLRTAASARVFTPVVLQMIAVGEETGQLDTMMLEVADFYDREVEYDIANLSSIIEPVLTVVVGIMVLVLALGIFLPMWDLTQLASRR